MAASSKQTAKRALRAQMKDKLSALSEADVTAESEAAQDVILAHPLYKQAKHVGIYLSMPNAEAQTNILVRDALNGGKSVFVPYIYPVGDDKPKRKIMDMLQLSDVSEYEGLARDSWGIPKLPKDGHEQRENAMGGTGLSFQSTGELQDMHETSGGLDVIVVPAVAFDEGMNRLGHGAGFYDSYLSRYCSRGGKSKPFLVGLCLANQILPPGQLVMEDWDWKVDAIAVGDGRLLTP